LRRPETPASEKARVLIIDDSEDITGSVKLGLESTGLTSVDAYNDPVEAVKKFKAGVYTLVVLDVGMPKMNGFNVYRKLRMVDKEVRICLLTAFDIQDEDFTKMFPEVEVCKVLRKPISMNALVGQLNQLLVV
jgi:two-component system, OmpR family, response regulator ChvI